ncbi:FecR family protein [Filimonas effusa]|uniref:FecR family protein n=1 Tax=Filimonas effusa TaxID=2508721 RepID=A0A4V1M9K3_9BACT|nr:FecR family protein [Filimonas effusa]RXK81448.1 FecR family protein [Filimonas effusa]
MAKAAERVQELLSGYLDNQLTEREYKALWQLMAGSSDRDLTEILDYYWDRAAFEGEALPAAVWEQKIKELINNKQDTGIPVTEPGTRLQTAAQQGAKPDNMAQPVPQTKLRRLLPATRWWAVAATVFVLVLTALLWPRAKKGVLPSAAGDGDAPAIAAIKPATNKAVLTLADGSTVALDSAVNGIVAAQGALKVQQQQGQLTYAHQAAAGEQVFYNTLTTPRGGKYRLLLPDGSQVWLNAASSIRYPTAFAGKERVVELTGEAYFDIVANERQPFRVNSGGQQVTVLGTGFNVNAYTDERLIRTTLVSGSIKVAEQVPQTGASVVLTPGNQARFVKGSIRVKEVNTEDETAWKNDLFAFNDVDFETVIRELSRWYDVEITFKGQMPGRQLMGNVSRNYSITQVLKMLAFAARIDYEIDGRKITLSSK